MNADRVRVKVCGITRVEDAVAAAQLGADAIGLIFTARSPRRLDLDAAAAIARALPPFVTRVGLFMDDPAALVEDAFARVGLDIVQFHGAEDAQWCQQFERPYLKAVPMADAAPDVIAAAAAAHPRAAGLVLDGHGAGEAGGSGRRFDWALARASQAPPIVLAGGLSPDNVAAAIKLATPWAVDVSSGVESAVGIKDRAKMQRFITEVYRVTR